jgi:hypothetical protein
MKKPPSGGFFCARSQGRVMLEELARTALLITLWVVILALPIPQMVLPMQRPPS